MGIRCSFAHYSLLLRAYCLGITQLVHQQERRLFASSSRLPSREEIEEIDAIELLGPKLARDAAIIGRRVSLLSIAGLDSGAVRHDILEFCARVLAT